MKNESRQASGFNRKKLSFLLPAVLTGILVFDMLPQTQVPLRDIPEKLQLIEEVSAEEPEEPAAAPAAKKRKKKASKEDETPKGVGNYEDGVFTGSSQGYGGLITVQVTVKDGQITDVQILSAPGETDPYFSLAQSVIDQVKTAQTWEVDTVSGATYSSRGILGAIQNALTGEAVENAAAPKVTPSGTKQQDTFTDPKAYKDGTYTGTAQGFGGPITVKVVIKDGKISSIDIESASGETGSYLDRARSVISSIVSKGSPNVDAVSGATYSSTGIINAVKRALQKAATDPSKQEEVVEEKPVKKTKKKKTTAKAKKQKAYKEPAAYKDGVYYGTADGFGGDIKVKVTISNGKLKKIEIVSAKDETEEYLNKAKAVISAMIKKGSPNVDTISGATYSSTGIINAVKEAMSQAATDSGKSKKTTSGKKAAGSGSTGSTSTSVTPSKPSNQSGGTSTPASQEETLQDGIYTGTGKGFGGDVVVQVTISGGKISDVSIVSAEDETPSFFNRAKKLLDDVIAAQSADVDTVSGATRSSNGILEGLRNALAKAVKKTAEPGQEASKDPSGSDEPGSEASGGGSSGNEPGTESPGGQTPGTDTPGTDSPGGQTPGTDTPGTDTPGGGTSGSDTPGETPADGQTYYKDGTYTASGWCDDGEWFRYEISVTLTVKDGKIVSVKIGIGEDESDDPEDNDYYINRAVNGTSKYPGMVKQILSAQSADVDIVSSATWSSTTIRNLAAGILKEIKVSANTEEDSAKEAEEKPTEASNEQSDTAKEGNQQEAGDSTSSPSGAQKSASIKKAQSAAGQPSATEAAGSENIAPEPSVEEGQDRNVIEDQQTDTDKNDLSDSAEPTVSEDEDPQEKAAESDHPQDKAAESNHPQEKAAESDHSQEKAAESDHSEEETKENLSAEPGDSDKGKQGAQAPSDQTADEKKKDIDIPPAAEDPAENKKPASQKEEQTSKS